MSSATGKFIINQLINSFILILSLLLHLLAGILCLFLRHANHFSCRILIPLLQHLKLVTQLLNLNKILKFRSLFPQFLQPHFKGLIVARGLCLLLWTNRKRTFPSWQCHSVVYFQDGLKGTIFPGFLQIHKSMCCYILRSVCAVTGYLIIHVLQLLFPYQLIFSASWEYFTQFHYKYCLNYWLRYPSCSVFMREFREIQKYAAFITILFIFIYIYMHIYI